MWPANARVGYLLADYSSSFVHALNLHLFLSVCPKVCLSVCLSVFRNVCYSVFPSVCLSFRMCLSLSVHQSACLSCVIMSVCLSVFRLYVCQTIRMSVFLFVCQNVLLSDYVNMRLSEYLFVCQSLGCPFVRQYICQSFYLSV